MRGLIIAESGFGKTTCLGANAELGIRGLNPQRTFLVNVSVNKDLVFRGWKKQYVSVPEKAEPTTGNYLESNDANVIVKVLKYITEKRQNEFDTLVVDDLQYLMADFYMDNAVKGGFDVFKDIGLFMGKLFKTFQQWKGDVICLSHFEEITNNFNTTYKAKTVGKLSCPFLSNCWKLLRA